LFKISIFILISSDIDSRENNFFVTEGNNLFYVFIYIFCRTANGASPHLGNDAKRTEIVTAILDFNQAAGMQSIVGGIIVKQIFLKPVGRNDFSPKMGFHERGDGRFMVVIHNIIHFVAFF